MSFEQMTIQLLQGLF